MFTLPPNESIPGYLYSHNELRTTFQLLGFRENELYNMERLYRNDASLMDVAACECGGRWTLCIACKTTSKDELYWPHQFDICDDLAPIELLAVLYKEWNHTFPNQVLPDKLIFGEMYRDNLETLRNSRPPKPSITVERDVLRLYLSKIKKLFDPATEDYELIFSFTDGQLKIAVKSTVYILQAETHNLTEGTVHISARQFFGGPSMHFMHEKVSIRVEKNGIGIDRYTIPARWDGKDLWEYDEYDRELQRRLMHRAPLFLFGYNDNSGISKNYSHSAAPNPEASRVIYTETRKRKIKVKGKKEEEKGGVLMDAQIVKRFINVLFHRLNYCDFHKISELMMVKPHFIGSPREAGFAAERSRICDDHDAMKEAVKEYIEGFINRPEIACELTHEEKSGILDALHGKPSPWIRPWALFMCGVQGSGRTSDLPDEAREGALVIDADTIVPALTLAENTEEAQYQLYSTAAKQAESQAMEACREKKRFIFETTLAFDFSKLETMIKTILANDGDIMIRYLDVSAVTSRVRLSAWEQIYEKPTYITIKETVDAYNCSLPAYMELFKRYEKENHVSFKMANNDVDLEEPKEVFEKIVDPIGKKKAKGIEEEAVQDLKHIQDAKAYHEYFNEVKLMSIDQLPDIDAEKIKFIWDNQRGEDGGGYVHVMVGNQTIWKEPVIFEGWPRFNEIKQMLKEKYGSRFVELRPTERSETYLYGDDFSAPGKVTFT